jgi:mRNA-degrading endonuclease RelE of RelBE toxin-antitoxin system
LPKYLVFVERKAQKQLEKLPKGAHKRIVEALHTLLLRARVKNLWRLYILEVVKKK